MSMTPEQYQLFSKTSEAAIEKSIEKYVNGGIRRIDAQLKSHIENFSVHVKNDEKYQERIEPYLEGASGLGFLWKLLVALGAAAVAWSQVKGFFWK